MTVEKCQELHVIGLGQPQVMEWYCTCTKRKVSRWNFGGYQSMIYEENSVALDQLCDCCEVPNQD